MKRALIAVGVFLVLVAARALPAEPVDAKPIKNGSVLFWEDGLLLKPILRNTGSHLTHAAVILDGYVYEAVPPRVHKVLLSEYLRANKHKYFIIQPKALYTLPEVWAMVTYAESELGRPYMIRGFGKRVTRGVFCSEFAGNVLEKGGRIKSSNFHESPGSLYEKLKRLYQ